MANPFAGIISTEIKDLFQNAIDALLENTALTTSCRLVFAGEFTECPNCYFNTLTGKSSGIPKPTAIVAFIEGQICPYCGGEGRLFTDQTENIDIAVIRDYRRFVGVNVKDLQNPEGFIQTISKIGLLPKLTRAKQLVISTNIERFDSEIFEKDSTPQPMGFGNDRENYVFILWRRIG